MVAKLSSLCCCLGVAGVLQAEPPTASYIFPAGGQRGQTVDIRVGGLFLQHKCSFEMLGSGVITTSQLQKTRTLWLEGPLVSLPESQQAEDYPKDMAGRVQIARDAPLGVRHWRLWNSQGATPAKTFLVGDLPEIVEQEIEGDPVPVDVKLPVTINGRIFPREDVDIWSFAAHKGQVITAEVCAARLGSPLDSRLEVRDPQGRVLAENDDAFGADSFVRFRAPAHGKYQVRIHDINFRGGQAYVYRLTVASEDQNSQASAAPQQNLLQRGEITEPDFSANSARTLSPDFRLRLASDVLAIDRGSQGKLKVQAERLDGFAQPIALSVTGLPASIAVTDATIAAGQNAAELTFKPGSSAAIRGTHVSILGKARTGAGVITRTALFTFGRDEPAIDSVLLAVTLPTPFKILGDYDMRWAPRGTVHERRYRIERGGYQGPIEVSLADRQMRHLQGVAGSTLVVPAGVNEFTYAVRLPPWMETGRTSRACVMGVGTIKDLDGSEHEMSFSSVAPNEQIIAVIEPGELGVECGRSSILAMPGQAVSLPVRMIRGRRVHSAVKVELICPGHIHGIVADPLSIPADQGNAQLTVHFADNVQGPYNAPLVIRATALHNSRPVVGETKVDVRPGPR